MATRPPRVTSTRRQPTTRGGPRVTSRTRQPTTPMRIPRMGPSWYRPPVLKTGGGAVAAGGVPTSAVQAPQYSLSNLPVDADYDKQVIALQKQRDDQFTAIAAERARTLSDYGFQEGAGGMLTFDPNNPFSKSAVMKKTFDTNRRSTGQSMASGGQLYSGAFQNAQDLVNRNQLQSEDALQKNVLAFLARNTSQRAEAGTGYEVAVGQADAERTARFQNNPNYDPAAAGPGGGAAPAAAAAAAAAPRTAASIAAAMRRRARATGLRGVRI